MEEIKSFPEDNNYKRENFSLKKTGNLIKEARLSRDKSLEELAADLKIGAHQLKAIEEGDEEKLPEKVFIKAMVRRITQKLKLDTEFIMDEYKRERENLETKEIDEDIAKKTDKSKKSKNVNLLGFGIFILISGFLGVIASSLIFNLLPDSFQNQTQNQELIEN